MSGERKPRWTPRHKAAAALAVSAKVYHNFDAFTEAALEKFAPDISFDSMRDEQRMYEWGNYKEPERGQILSIDKEPLIWYGDHKVSWRFENGACVMEVRCPIRRLPLNGPKTPREIEAILFPEDLAPPPPEAAEALEARQLANPPTTTKGDRAG